MNKEELEEILVAYGVAFTDCLADRLLEEIEKIKKDAVVKTIANIRVGLGKVQDYEFENEDTYVHFKYYKADKVLGLLSQIGAEDDNN